MTDTATFVPTASLDEKRALGIRGLSALGRPVLLIVVDGGMDLAMARRYRMWLEVVGCYGLANWLVASDVR